MNYYHQYSEALKFSADHSTLSALLKGMKHADWVGGDEADHTKRGVLADAYEETSGDTEGASHLRDPDQSVVYHEGRMKPAVVKYRQVAFDQSEDNEGLDHLDAHGPEATLRYLKNNYDYGSGELLDKPGHGSGDRTFHDDTHTLSWNSWLGYWGLNEEHLLPAEHAHHNYMGEDGESLRVGR